MKKPRGGDDADLLRQRIAQLEGQVELLKDMVAMAGAAGRDAIVGGNPSALDVAQFSRLTLKQHAVVQMMIRGAPSGEMAKRLDCSVSTIKSIVAAVMHRFGVNNRIELAGRVRPVMDRLTANEYLSTAGLEKDWDAKWDEGDPVNG